MGKNMDNLEYKRISKRAESAMRVTSIITSFLFLAVAVGADFGLMAAGVVRRGGAVSIIIPCIATFVCIAYIVLAPAIRYKRYKYYLDDDMLIVEEGLWFITRSIAPIERIHQIELGRGPIDRMFKLSNVTVITAGGRVKIDFLEDDVAEELASRLKTRINSIVKQERGEAV